MAIEDPYVAYCFDEAIGEFGSYVRGELGKVEGKTQKAIEGKQTLVLKRLLEGDVKKQFAQPISTKGA